MGKFIWNFLLLMLFIVLPVENANTSDKNTFQANHDLVPLGPPEVVVQNNGVTIQKLVALTNFTGDLTCTAHSVATLITHASGRTQVSIAATFPWSESPEPCTFQGQPFVGTAHSEVKGMEVLTGHFNILGTLGDESNLVIQGTTVITMDSNPPAALDGFYVLTP